MSMLDMYYHASSDEARTYRRRLCVARSVDGGQCEGLRYAERADGTVPTPYLYICTKINNNSSLQRSW